MIPRKLERLRALQKTPFMKMSELRQIERRMDSVNLRFATKMKYCMALGRSRRPEAIPLLRRFLEDERETVRAQADGSLFVLHRQIREDEDWIKANDPIIPQIWKKRDFKPHQETPNKWKNRLQANQKG